MKILQILGHDIHKDSLWSISFGYTYYLPFTQFCTKNTAGCQITWEGSWHCTPQPPPLSSQPSENFEYMKKYIVGIFQNKRTHLTVFSWPGGFFLLIFPHTFHLRLHPEGCCSCSFTLKNLYQCFVVVGSASHSNKVFISHPDGQSKQLLRK